MTDLRWPYEYDRKFWTRQKNSHRQTLTSKFDWKYNKYYHNDEHYHVNISKNIFGRGIHGHFGPKPSWLDHYSLFYEY